jgi:GNAT superfamily N-acetyltransferase
MGVLAGHRGRGIGSRMLTSALALGRERGFLRTELVVRADNARAWLRDVSAGRAAVSGGNTTSAATPIARASTAPSTASSSERGW